MGRASGVTEEQMLALREHATSTAFSDVERIVLDYAVLLTKTPVSVPDDVFAKLREHLDEGQVVELTASIAWENYRARYNHALGIESQGFSEGAVCALPERAHAAPS